MPNKFRDNSFTPRQRRVLNHLLKTYEMVLSSEPNDEHFREITESLREVIDSASPDADNAAAH
jgi:hypothetical protein